ncbi:hypothetical protein ACFE04_021671 [Oxalis oulophora]
MDRTFHRKVSIFQWLIRIGVGLFGSRQFQRNPFLVNISCVGCNLIGPLPEFIGSLKSLTTPLNLSYSRLYCEISANLTTLQKLQLNGDLIVCMVLEILANMELRIVAHGSSIAGSPQSTPSVSTVLGILVTENQTPKSK